MALRVVYCAFIFAASLNFILTIEDTDVDFQNEKDIRVGRAYSLTTCNYENQAGFTCISCHRAIHCYISGAAIMVDCYGLFRFCRDGHCSRHQGAKCSEDTKLTTAASELMNMTSHTEDIAVSNVAESEAISTPM